MSSIFICNCNSYFFLNYYFKQYIMCITINTAKLSKTKILSVSVGNGNHFIAYSNSVQNLSGKQNAMILAIPGKTKQEWFYDTTAYNKFLDDIISEADYEEDYLGIRSRGITMKSLSVFNVGMYTVGLADSFNDALDFIKEKAEITDSLAVFFKERYKGWSFAVCLFDSEKKIDAQPIAFEYTPFDKNLIYFPTMDAHTGNAPDMNEKVDVDHTFIYEHTGNPDEKLYQEFVELENKDIPSFLNKRRFRYIEVKSNAEPNGDTYINATELSAVPFSQDTELERG